MIKKIGSVIGNILIAVVLVFALLMTAMVIMSSRDEDGVPNVFGYAVMNVETDSMEGPAGFDEGDLIIIRMTEHEEANNLKVGDVITFRRFFQNKPFLDTHRIVEHQGLAPENEIVDGIWLRGDTRYYTTKGDNVDGIDAYEDGSIEYANALTIIGVWEGISIPFVGGAIKFLQSQTGFLVCIVIPVAIFFFFELYHFIVTLNEKRKVTALEEVSASEDEIKQKAIEEYLAQQAEAEKAAAEAKEKEAAEAQAAAQKAADEAKRKAAEEEAQKALSEEEMKQKVIEEYLAKKAEEEKAAEEAKRKAAEEEALKQKIIEEYLAKQAEEAQKSAPEAAPESEKPE